MGPTKDEEIAELRRKAEQCRAEVMDAADPDMQKRLLKQAEAFELQADERERKP